MLRRVGNKARIAHKIVPLFPPHTHYIELFFGAGGLYFNKPPAKYNFCNDLDSEVFNFWQVYKDPETKAQLLPAISFRHIETQPVLFLSMPIRLI